MIGPHDWSCTSGLCSSAGRLSRTAALSSVYRRHRQIRASTMPPHNGSLCSSSDTRPCKDLGRDCASEPGKHRGVGRPAHRSSPSCYGSGEGWSRNLPAVTGWESTMYSKPTACHRLRRRQRSPDRAGFIAWNNSERRAWKRLYRSDSRLWPAAEVCLTFTPICIDIFC